MLGNVQADPSDQVLVLPARDLLADRDAIQRALATASASRTTARLHDRAMSLVVGPGPGETMVVLRDPDQDEEPDPDAEPDELPDTWGLRGVYLRDLATCALIERAEWDVPFAKLTAIAATPSVIAVEVASGVAVRDRRTGEVKHIAGAALDPLGARLALPKERGVWRVRPLPG
jgi:hypothetical protein